MEEITENTERALRAACEMYHTAAALHNSGLVQDANAVAAKAKTLMNAALEGVVDLPPSTQVAQ